MATETATAYKNFVGGEWLDAVEGATMDVINPATGEKNAAVPRGSQADVHRAVESAKNALPCWLQSTPGERRARRLRTGKALEPPEAFADGRRVGRPGG